MVKNTFPRVVGLGALNVDRIFRVERLLADGESAIEDGGSFAGGSAANTIYGLSRLGVTTGVCGAVGDDSNGRLLLADFKKVGADTSHIITLPGVSSGTVFCLSAPRKRSLYVLAGANGSLSLQDIDLAYINHAEYLHLSSFVDDAQFGLSQKIVERLSPKVKLSFSPGALYVARGMKALKPFFMRTHIIFINRDEIEKLTGLDYQKAAGACLKAGCKAVAVTLGRGVKLDGRTVVAYIRDNRNEWFIDAGKPSRAKVVDTTGAGDAFAAGFLFGLLEGKPHETCGRLGHCAARLSLKCSGARGGLPTRRQLEQHFLKLYGKSE
ncbi:MAG: carbohydrate kinase family protein [Dehalococcoidia bacterium]|nr:MAG: carbohydrate kinase family protein [Dehalococcoidia bacterium]